MTFFEKGKVMAIQRKMAAVGAVILFSGTFLAAAMADDGAATAPAVEIPPTALTAPEMPAIPPTTAPSVTPAMAGGDMAEARPRARLPKEFARLSDLTEDQKTQIVAIQAKLDEQMAELRKQALADQRAVLTDGQRTELEANAAKAKLETRAARARERAAMASQDAGKSAPATQPDGQ